MRPVRERDAELVESVGEPNRFSVREEYADEASLAAHPETTHYNAMMAQAAEVLAGAPDIRKFDVTSVTPLKLRRRRRHAAAARMESFGLTQASRGKLGSLSRSRRRR